MLPTQRLLDLTAEDVMTREPLTIPHGTPMRQAARLLRRAGHAAPVVDGQGRCVGALSAADFLRWAQEGCPDAVAGPPRVCPFQTEGRLLNGEEAVICTRSPGSCALQAIRPTTAGRRTAVCVQPVGVLCDWQQLSESPPAVGSARHYATTDVLTAGPRTPLRELARRMADAQCHEVFVLDEQGRPVGVVCCTDVLAAVARRGEE